MRDEDDNDPDPAVFTWTVADLAANLSQHFMPWSPQLGPAVFSLYETVAQTVSPATAYYDLDADLGVTCGHLKVSQSYGCTACWLCS